MNIKKIVKQADWWKYLAKGLPLIFLGLLFLMQIFGWQDYIGKTIVIGGGIFFCFAVVWWWWAIKHIVVVLTNMQTTNNKLLDVIKELKGIRKDLQ